MPRLYFFLCQGKESTSYRKRHLRPKLIAICHLPSFDHLITLEKYASALTPLLRIVGLTQYGEDECHLGRLQEKRIKTHENARKRRKFYKSVVPLHCQ